MENERVAKFFISTLLDKQVVSVDLKPQEFTYTDQFAGLAVFRLDFVAVIRTEDGVTKKVLIEIQKAKNQIDLMRFRNYLAEQYKKEDVIDNEKEVLPITTIYILGFKLPKIDSACIHVERQYKDLINDGIIGEKSEFVEKLTHDSYVVQVDRITDRFKSRIDKLLSVFEQSNFIDDSQIIKEYKHLTDEDDIKLITEILHHSGIDPEARKQIEIEREAWRTVDAMVKNQRIAFQKALDEKNKALDEKNKALAEKNKALNEKDKLIQELKRKLKEE